MDIFGDRQFVEIPGSETHALPPLLVRTGAGVRRLDRVMSMAEKLIDQEDLIPARPDGNELDLRLYEFCNERLTRQNRPGAT